MSEKSEDNESKIWAVVAIFIFILVIYFLSKHTHYITSVLTESGPFAPLVAILLYSLLAPTPIPTDPITLILGVVYGPFIGVIIAWIGNILATLVEYYIGAHINRKTNHKFSKNKLPLGLSKLPVNSIAFLIFGRMIPGYGSKIISILAGAYKVPLKRYLWTSAATSLFGSIFLVYGGFGLVSIIKYLKILKTLGL